MNEEFPINKQEATLEQQNAFILKIESLRPLLGENTIDSLPGEHAEGDALYSRLFKVEDKVVDVAITELLASPEDEEEKIPSSRNYDVSVIYEDKTDDITVRTTDEYSIQLLGSNLGDVVVYRQTLSVKKGDNPFEEVIGNKHALRELIDKFDGDIAQAEEAYKDILRERHELDKAAGEHPLRFTQEKFDEVMGLLEQIR